MGLLFTYLLVALISSFICSILEATLLSIPVTFLKMEEDNGKKKATKMLKQKEDVERPLSAILSLNTIAHTVGAAGVGAQANIVFGEAYFAVVSAVLTILILVLTEIIPKTLGSNYAKNLYGIATTLIDWLMWVTYPLVIFSSWLTRFISSGATGPTTSREEIAILAHIGTHEGVFVDKENLIIQNLIQLKNISLKTIITPRVVVVIADEEMTLSNFLKNKENLHFSRIPVYTGDKENITGYILREEVFEHLAADKFNIKLSEIKRKILVFPETITVISAWEKMQQNKDHIALVVDEYGGMSGIVTLEDIIETLIGMEIMDEKDQAEDMQKFAMDKWKAKQRKYQILSYELKQVPKSEN